MTEFYNFLPVDAKHFIEGRELDKTAYRVQREGNVITEKSCINLAKTDVLKAGVFISVMLSRVFI